MPEFLVETYVSRVAMADDPRRLEIVKQAADELTQEGTPVRFLHSIFLPVDETCFYLYQAGSVDGVVEAVSRAGLQFERVIEAESDSAAAID